MTGPDVERRPPGRQRFPARLDWRTIRIRPPIVAALAVVFVTAALVPALLDAGQPLRFGGSTIGGETPLLLGFSAPGESWAGRETIYYAYRPFEEVRIQVGLANDADVPVTIEGLALDADLNGTAWRTWFSSVELRLPPAPTLDSLPLASPAAGPLYSEPFRPFQLGPHQATTLAVVGRFRDCRSSPGPKPTRAPGATPQVGYSDVGLGLANPLTALPVRYSVFGAGRTVDVALPEQIGIVQLSKDGAIGCPDYVLDQAGGPG